MTATVTISVEIELAWGAHDTGRPWPHLSADRTAESEALDRLLRTCDEHRLPISFDVVGHLFHESCDGHRETPHPEGWFDSDPYTDVDTDPLFYAPDLIAAVRGADAPHEICTHTYSHVLCDAVDPEVLAWELERVQTLHAGIGLDPPRSFVAPRHRTAPREVLKDAGIDVLRVPYDDYDPWPGGRVGKAAWLLGRRHPVGEVRTVDGLVETPCTPHPSLTAHALPQGQSSPHPVLAAIPVRLRQAIHGRYLRQSVARAEARDAHVHLWTHLYNLSNECQWEVIAPFLRFLDSRRSKGIVDVQPMRELC